ncbi:uncharacterized protein SPPG_07974 [Spizellomyces punctatus DAOM BR117]|uniref:Uncharacterized protein n=1 Tax=Spizellomyces punctatus (strain DAOM BR117) TaxID=645134 RepID=A0A0L0H6C6_SPIPD|nr:uncharacterized protein SPPG_07974 [Spizellomyces punctatus DAOM BR117]KNC96767.1 hypothetical protein SPPG_07974 [Spizellomyces punctatus DAOM BR117]|eukprot:XP_016604807.1 hypothetical protein SPPG_07974 [Spizellomyces punctatus DAOM BR117]
MPSESHSSSNAHTLATPWLRAVRIATDWHLSTRPNERVDESEADLQALLYNLSTISGALLHTGNTRPYTDDERVESTFDDDVDHVDQEYSLYRRRYADTHTVDIIMDPGDDATIQSERGYKYQIVKPLRRRAHIRRQAHHPCSNSSPPSHAPTYAQFGAPQESSAVPTFVYSTLPLAGKLRKKTSIHRTGSAQLLHRPRRYPPVLPPPRVDSLHGMDPL